MVTAGAQESAHSAVGDDEDQGRPQREEELAKSWWEIPEDGRGRGGAGGGAGARRQSAKSTLGL